MADTRVLIVHDDPGFVERVRTALAAALPGSEALSAISGPRALGIAKQHRPSVIVADGDLEGMDGYAFTAELKSDPDLAATPVVIVAREPSEASALKARQVGAAAHVPVDIEPPSIDDIIATRKADRV